MNPGPASTDPARLPLAELFSRDAGRLRTLARSLVACDQTAEDLVQDAFVAATERPPQQSSSLANWLSVVIRNRARSLRLQESRRRQHERNAATPDPLSDSGFERMELLRILVAAVQELPPNYREVIVLRFFEDHPPRQIAQRLGVPVDTVRTRIRRGLETLRGRLDAEGGGREAWVSSFLPLALPYPASGATASGSLSSSASPTGAAPVAGAKSGLGTALKGIAAMQMHLNKSLAIAGLLLLALTAGLLAFDIEWRSTKPGLSPLDGQITPLSHQAGSSQPLDSTPNSDSPVGNPERRIAVSAPPTTTVRGRVLERSDRRPVSDLELFARVYPQVQQEPQLGLGEETQLSNDAPWFETTIQSDEAGAFSFELPIPEGEVQATAPLTGLVRFEVARGPWVHRIENMSLRQGALHGLEVEVVALDAEVEGQVRDANGAPIADATIRVGFEPSITTTDADGNYRLRYPSREGRLEISVVARGHAAYQADIQLEEGDAQATRHDVQLAPAQVLRGRVVTAGGRPVPGAFVYSGLMVSHTRTDRDGSFSIDWVAAEGPSAPEWLHVRAAGYLDGHLEIPTSASELQIELERATPVTGLVVDSEGAPVVGASVYLRPENAHNREADALTDADGRFHGFTSPRWRALSVDAAGFALARFGVPHNTDGSELDIGPLVLSRGRTVTGRVVDESGDALSGVGVFGRARLQDVAEKKRVLGLGLLTVTDSEGEFTLRDMPTRGLALNFVERGYLPERVDPVSSTVSVVLQRQGGVAGRVIDGATRKPISSFRVRLAESDRGERRVRGWRSTWTDGRAFENDDGIWSTADNRFADRAWLAVSASADGYAPSPFRSVQTTSFPSPEDCVIELWKGGRVTGRCVDPAGAPIRGATVQLFPCLREGNWSGPRPYAAEDHDARAIRPMEGRSDRDGTFTFDAVSPGTASLLVLVEGRPTVFVSSIEVPRQGRAAPVTITVPGGTTIEGSLLGDLGLASVQSVTLIPLDPAPGQRRRYEAELTEPGRYRASGLRPGSYELVVEARTKWSKRVEIPPDIERLSEDIAPPEAAPRVKR